MPCAVDATDRAATASEIAPTSRISTLVAVAVGIGTGMLLSLLLLRRRLAQTLIEKVRGRQLSGQNDDSLSAALRKSSK